MSETRDRFGGAPKPRSISRRRTLRTLGVVAFSSGALGWLGCTPGREGAAGDGGSLEERASRYDPKLDCSASDELYPAEVATRTENAYTQSSPHEEQHCYNCTQFIPADDYESCASCNTVEGPIHPLGWCEAWTEVRGPA